MPAAKAPEPEPIPTREQLAAMSAGRDRYCGTEDPWVRFAHGAKSPETIAMLRAWAEDPAEQESGAEVALEALSEEKGPALLEFWKAQLALAPKDSRRRSFVVVGLINSGATDAALELLGESEQLDSVIISSVTNRSDSKSTLDKLKTYAARPRTSAASRKLITERWLTLSRGDDADDERLALMSNRDTTLAYSAIWSARPSAQTLRQGLELLRRPDLPEFERKTLSADLGENLGDLLEKRDVEAQKLAATWARSTDPLLLEEPWVQVMLASWLQSRGELARAEAVLVRSLEAHRDEPPPERFPIEGDRVIARTVSRLLLVCQLEGQGRRQEAVQRYHELEPFMKKVESEGRRVLESARFGYRPAGCDFRTIGEVVSQPLQLAFEHRELKGRLEVTLKVTNASSTNVTLQVCPASGGGLLPQGELRLAERGRRLSTDFDCRSPVEQVLPPGKVLTSTVLAFREAPTGYEREDLLRSASLTNSKGLLLSSVKSLAR